MANLKLNRPLCFFDLETTGINIGKDRIVEICIIKVYPDSRQEIFEQRVNPGIPIPPESTAIHNITNQDVKDKPLFKDIAIVLRQFIDDSNLAGFNALRFDLPLLVEEFLRAEVEFEIRTRQIIDVQNIYHKMEPRNLSAAYRFYCNKDLANAHSALADTQATLEVLKAQISHYENVTMKTEEGIESYPIQNDVNVLAAFSQQYQSADLAGHIVYDSNGVEIFNFGKHKGKSVSDILCIEPQYFDWMMRSDFPLYTKKILTGIRLRNFGNKKSVLSDKS